MEPWPVHISVKKIRMSLVLNLILKLLSRPVVCAPLKGLEINIYFVLLSIYQVYSTTVLYT
jgi:hypothetical protein